MFKKQKLFLLLLISLFITLTACVTPTPKVASRLIFEIQPTQWQKT